MIDYLFFVFLIQRWGPGSTHTLRRDVGVEGGEGKGRERAFERKICFRIKNLKTPKTGRDLDLQRFFLGRQPNPAQLVLYR